MRTVTDTLHIETSFTTVEQWRRWIADVLKMAGYRQLKFNDDDSISANYYRIPLGKIRVSLTESLHWDGVSRNSAEEFDTYHTVDITVKSNAFLADPQILIDRLADTINSVNLSELLMHPKVSQTNKRGRRRSQWMYGLIAVLILSFVAGWGVESKMADTAKAQREVLFLTNVHEAAMVTTGKPAQVEDKDALGLGYKLCYDLSFNQEGDTGNIDSMKVQENMADLKHTIALFAIVYLCPEHMDKLERWAN